MLYCTRRQEKGRENDQKNKKNRSEPRIFENLGTKSCSDETNFDRQTENRQSFCEMFESILHQERIRERAISDMRRV